MDMISYFHSLTSKREFGLVVLIGLIAAAVGMIDSSFLAASNIRDILVRSAPTVIVACGLMLVVVTGEIDISVGSLMGLLAACMGILLSTDHLGWSVWAGLPLVILSGSLIGGLTGLLVTWGRVPSIIATLGLLTALRGITTLSMRGENIDDLPNGLTELAKYGVFGLPLGLWVAIIVIAVTGVILNRTSPGRQLFAIGSSGYSASMLGLPVGRLKVFCFIYLGVLTALATIVDVPRLPKIEAGIGSGFELLVVTCVVVGGVSITGGRGSLTGVVLAVILLTMIRPALTFLDVGEAGEKWTKAIQGTLIVLAVISDSLSGGYAKMRNPAPAEAKP